MMKPATACQAWVHFKSILESIYGLDLYKLKTKAVIFWPIYWLMCRIKNIVC